MKNVILIRTSTTDQTGAGQVKICTEAAAEMHKDNPIIFTFASSANSKATTAQIDAAMRKAGRGGAIIISELSRLGRNVAGVLTTLKQAQEAGVAIIDARRRAVFDDSLSDKILITLMALMAEIEHDLIKTRTTESLTQIKKNITANGFHITKAGKKITEMGRPAGSTRPPRIMHKADEIMKLRAKGNTYREIAAIVGSGIKPVIKVVKIVEAQAKQ